MKTILIILFLVIVGRGQVFSQMYKSKNPLEIELYRLVTYKYNYEENVAGVKAKAEGYIVKRDSTLKIYSEQIAKIKSQRDSYLPHIDSVIKENDTKARVGFTYMYFNTSKSWLDPQRYTVSRLDAYKIFRYSLFEKDQDMLPEDPQTLPFVKKYIPRKTNIEFK